MDKRELELTILRWLQSPHIRDINDLVVEELADQILALEPKMSEEEIIKILQVIKFKSSEVLINHQYKLFYYQCQTIAHALAGKIDEPKMSEEELAHFLHANYELFSIDEGWNTQESCKVKFDDLPAANKRVMRKLAHALTGKIDCGNAQTYTGSLIKPKSESPKCQHSGNCQFENTVLPLPEKEPRKECEHNWKCSGGGGGK